jgi:hypothetical protein
MDFDQLVKDLQNHLSKVIFKSSFLYETLPDDKNLLWELYLESFPPGTNPIYKEKTEHDCNSCKSFMRNFASVVAINNDYELVSIWDFKTKSGYQPVIDELAKAAKSFPIKKFYFSNFQNIGTAKSYDSVPQFKHLNTVLPHNHNCFCDKVAPRYNGSNTFYGKSIDTINGTLCTNKKVFQSSLEAISKEAIEIVLELIAQNSLYRGEEKKFAVLEFQKHHNVYHRLDNESKKDNYCWKHAPNAENVTHIKNHSIGVLLVDLSEGIELEEALRKYDAIMAPYNYKRPKAVFTKKMVENAKAKLVELGLQNSLQRRCATIDDIDINNVLFLDRNKADNKNETDIFGELTKAAKSKPREYKDLQEIAIEKFIKDVLPTAKEIKIYFENSHQQNLMSLITAENQGTKPLFSWDNTFSWAYNNNVADSFSFKENVKKAGGKIEGELRCSLQWNEDEIHKNLSDLDLHCVENYLNLETQHIHFANRFSRNSTGNLDIDIQYPRGVAVENIIYSKAPRSCECQFYVHNYRNNSGQQYGFKAEIEFNNQIYSYEYPPPLKQSEKIDIAYISFKDGNFNIEHKLPVVNKNKSSKQIWNLKTNELQPVSMICLSPNFWDNKNIGNKHYFFMLKDCIADCELNGFFNEFLHKDLYDHRKVFEMLGSMTKVSNPSIGNQLSGLGFSSTQKGNFVCEVTSQNLKKVLKVTI